MVYVCVVYIVVVRGIHVCVICVVYMFYIVYMMLTYVYMLSPMSFIGVLYVFVYVRVRRIV